MPSSYHANSGGLPKPLQIATFRDRFPPRPHRPPSDASRSRRQEGRQGHLCAARARSPISHNKLWNCRRQGARCTAKLFKKSAKDPKTKKTVTTTVKRTQPPDRRPRLRHRRHGRGPGARARAADRLPACSAIDFARTNDKGTPVAQAQLTPAYKFMVEQFMCAYVQECVYAARTARWLAVGRRTRLNRAIVKLACGEVNEQLFAASGVAPRNVYAVPLLKKKKDEDFKPASKRGPGGGGGRRPRRGGRAPCRASRTWTSPSRAARPVSSSRRPARTSVRSVKVFHAHIICVLATVALPMTMGVRLSWSRM